MFVVLNNVRCLEFLCCIDEEQKTAITSGNLFTALSKLCENMSFPFVLYIGCVCAL
jgi:hypothetical protein